MKRKIFILLNLSFFLTLISHAQVLQGKVTTTEKQAIPNATVHLLNTQLDVMTGTSGEFSIGPLTQGLYLLEVSAIGYATTQLEISFKPGMEVISIQLKNASLQLDAVFVSAQKKDEPLQKAPLAVTALSATQVKNYRLWNLQELTALAPNFSAENPGDGRNISSIRGIVNTSYDPSVAVYVDGVNQFSLDTYIGNLANIEKIEVLRGPQGTLYGRNAMGGVINIQTKQPGNKAEALLEMTQGNYGQQRHLLTFQSPLSKNKLYVGLTGQFDQRNGYYTNTLNQSSFDKQKGWYGNGFLKWIPGKDWTVQLNYKLQNNYNQGAFPLVNGVEDALNHPFELQQNALATMKDLSSNASLNIRRFGKKVQFNSITAWQKNHRFYDAPLDGDFSPADAVTIINDYGKEWNNVKVFTQEFRWNSAAGNNSPFDWTAGSYFYTQENPGKQATHFGKDAGLLGAPMTDFATISTTRGKNRGLALYGQANYAFTEKLSMTAGLRLDQERKQLSVKGEFQPDGSAAFVTQDDTTASVNYTALSPKIGLNFSINSNSLLYLSYARGFRTGGLTQLSSDPSQPPLYPYLPEFSNNLELGFKNNWYENKLRLHLTLFATTVSQVQVPTLVLPDAITVTRNTGKLNSKGAELELYASPLKGLQVEFLQGFTNARYAALELAQNGSAVNLKDKKQLFTPENTRFVALQYSYAPNPQKSLRYLARLEWKRLGTQYFDLGNQIRQHPYSLFNFRAGISTSKIDFYCWGRNLGNQKYIAYAYDFGAVHLGAPFTLGSTLSLRL